MDISIYKHVAIISDNNREISLPNVAKDCAKAIIDFVYDYDNFGLVQPYFDDGGVNLKIHTSQYPDCNGRNDALNYIFLTPASKMYEPKMGKNGKLDIRVYTNRDYSIKVRGNMTLCRLTTQWKDGKVNTVSEGNSNYVVALISVINDIYQDKLHIIERDGKRYLQLLGQENQLISQPLPSTFQTPFARRTITSLLAKPFVILTGNSGTGKTRIAKQFAQYLQVLDKAGNPNWALVPVGADWTDNTKVLGFYNPLGNDGAGKYEKTEVLQLIERANANSTVPYFLILDEMNLSHVERYFADFLSHMETVDQPFVLDNYKDENGEQIKLHYPTNLFVVGTVNIDETTYMFSPKVLDRANVVEFVPDKADIFSIFANTTADDTVEVANDGSAESFLKLAYQVRNGEMDDAVSGQMGDVKAIFDALYQALEPAGFAFAYRTVKEIRQYIAAAYKIAIDKEQFNLNAAIDEQVLQKVLPKVHGNHKGIGGLLDALKGVCDKNQLVMSAAKIAQMQKHLETMQYTSFI